jgi:hypothetical protein
MTKIVQILQQILVNKKAIAPKDEPFFEKGTNGFWLIAKFFATLFR